MKIAFDLRRIKNPGIGRYMKCLVEAVLRADRSNEYLLIVPPDGPCLQGSDTANVEVIRTALRYYSVQEQVALPLLLRKRAVDLLHSPHFLLPLVKTCPSVATIHDVIYLSCTQDLPSRAGRLYYGAMMKATARIANEIITDSEFSKRDIVRYLGAEPRKVEVIYPGFDPEVERITDIERLRAITAKYGIDRDFIFYTAIYKPRKNHAGLLRAFQHFTRNGGDAQLVLTGPLGEGERELRGVAQALGIAERVVFTGFVDDSELSALYSAARVYACPSLYEGFGFTLLEAMACGTPVVSTAETSLAEVGGDAALFADGNDANAFGGALLNAFYDERLRANLVSRGSLNLRRFDWRETAEKTLNVYRRVLGEAAIARACA